MPGKYRYVKRGQVNDSGLRAAFQALTVTQLAYALGINRQAITFWARVPRHRVLDVEAATGVSRHVLRPDLHPTNGKGDAPVERSLTQLPPRRDLMSAARAALTQLVDRPALHDVVRKAIMRHFDEMLKCHDTRSS